MPPGISEFQDEKLDSGSGRADALKGEEYVKVAGGGQRFYKIQHDYKNGKVTTVYDDGRNEVPDGTADDVESDKLYAFQKELQETQKEIEKLTKRLHGKQKQAEKAEKENITLREADKATQSKMDELQDDNKNLRGMVSKKEDKLIKSGKYNAKILEERVSLEEALRKAQAEHVAKSKKQIQKNSNLQEVNAKLKKKLNARNTSGGKDQALHDAGTKSQQERFEAMIKAKQEDCTLNMSTMKGKHEKFTTMVEELEDNLQSKREEVEVL